jgi:hypothetical protein
MPVKKIAGIFIFKHLFCEPAQEYECSFTCACHHRMACGRSVQHW